MTKKRRLLSDEQMRILMKEAGWDKLNEEELLDAVTEQLQVMIERGQVEQLIGEDGEFYYRSTGIFPFGITKNEQ